MLKTAARFKTALLETYVDVCAAEARRIRRGDLQGRARGSIQTHRIHAEAALTWLLRAQDLSGDGGVPAMYSLVQGWVGSYPETTGYIIPTLLDLSQRWRRNELRGRALRMADWLLVCQNDDGSFPGSFVGRLTGPRVFNTGQIIFGLLAAGRETGDGRYLSAARRAGDWLLRQQSRDGAWRRATLGNIVHVYNVRTAWALACLSEDTGERRYLDAAIANAEWVLGRQTPSGWFSDNTFEAGAEAATLHTIAYALQGLLELSLISGDDRLIKAARVAADALAEVWLAGPLPGEYQPDWTGTGDWRCLPGEAQLAVVWFRLGRVCAETGYSTMAHRLLDHIKAAQFMDPSFPNTYGGLSGALPIHAPYERYCVVNWGAKFLLDAILLAEDEHAAGPRG